VERAKRILLLVLIAACPAGAQTVLTRAPGPCFATDSMSYQIAGAASASDYRVMVAADLDRPHLRMQLVDHAETADFVLIDDREAEARACQSGAWIKTVGLTEDAGSADIVVGLTDQAGDAAVPHYRLYVRSSRFSFPEAAAILAVMWSPAAKAGRTARR